ncbi:MAG: phospholipid carrier-dependent glycosyltransferase [Ardenticatenia bacterium]|nr:phospholipid carrier-dependent glycosyltransferase [Ardenticatenia bacterium]
MTIRDVDAIARRPSRVRSIGDWLALPLILLGYFWLALGYARETPAWQVPDEPAHYNNVLQRAAPGPAPIIEAGDYPFARLEALKADRFANSGPDGIRGIEYEDHQPPLYYELAALLLEAQPEPVDPVRYEGETAPAAVVAERVRLLRLLGMVLGACTVLLAWAVASTVAPGDLPLRVGVTAFAAFLPMQLVMNAAVNNDPLAIALTAAALLVALRRVGRGPGGNDGWRGALLPGLLIGLAALTKLSALLPTVVVLLAAEWLGMGRIGRMGRIRPISPASPIVLPPPSPLPLPPAPDRHHARPRPAAGHPLAGAQRPPVRLAGSPGPGGPRPRHRLPARGRRGLPAPHRGLDCRKGSGRSSGARGRPHLPEFLGRFRLDGRVPGDGQGGADLWCPGPQQPAGAGRLAAGAAALASMAGAAAGPVVDPCPAPGGDRGWFPVVQPDLRPASGPLPAAGPATPRAGLLRRPPRRRRRGRRAPGTQRLPGARPRQPRPPGSFRGSGHPGLAEPAELHHPRVGRPSRAGRLKPPGDPGPRKPARSTRSCRMPPT